MYIPIYILYNNGSPFYTANINITFHHVSHKKLNETSILFVEFNENSVFDISRHMNFNNKNKQITT